MPQVSQLPTSDLTAGTSQLTKQRIKRSRNGCSSCKKLRIKCDEAKPDCEYCLHTGRECVYPTKPQSKKKQSSRKSSKGTNTSQSLSLETLKYTDHTTVISSRMTYSCLFNESKLSLNSLGQQLNINKFELRLLKCFAVHGGDFFSFGIDKDVENFWIHEVPKLWSSSELVKESLYSISCMMLWAQYELNQIPNIYVEDDLIVSKPNDFDAAMKGIPSLFERSNDFFQNTLSLLLKYSKSLKNENLDIVGQVSIAYISLFSLVSIHPYSPFPLVDYKDTADGNSVDLLEFCRMFAHDLLTGVSDALAPTKYGCLFYRREIEQFILLEKSKFLKENNTKFPMIESLRNYTDAHCECQYNLNSKYWVYQNVIDTIERFFHVAEQAHYVLPIYRAIIKISMNGEFVDLLRKKDYIAMKIMFYYSCVNSITDFKAFKLNSIWDTFLEEFKNVSFLKFNGDFEEKMDQRLYETATYLQHRKRMFKMNMLFKIGIESPISLFETGSRKVNESLVGYNTLPTVI